jgi:hypothetical protein
MTRQLISSGSRFEHDIGYSRAVVGGDPRMQIEIEVTARKRAA